VQAERHQDGEKEQSFFHDLVGLRFGGMVSKRFTVYNRFPCPA
jgi:hypothetical protein